MGNDLRNEHELAVQRIYTEALAAKSKEIKEKHEAES